MTTLSKQFNEWLEWLLDFEDLTDDERDMLDQVDTAIKYYENRP